jgi:hypothetical protein
VPPTLVCWTQELCLEGELVIAEPTTLRYRLWHTAGRLVRHGRRLVLCLQGTWPLDASAGGGVRAAAIPVRTLLVIHGAGCTPDLVGKVQTDTTWS